MPVYALGALHAINSSEGKHVLPEMKKPAKVISVIGPR